MSLEECFDTLFPEIYILCFTKNQNSFMLQSVFHVAIAPEHGVHIT